MLLENLKPTIFIKANIPVKIFEKINFCLALEL